MKQRILNSQRTATMSSKLPAPTTLSPTTAAATSGLRLNDPALRQPMGDANQQPALVAPRPVDTVKQSQQQKISAGVVAMSEKENNEPQRSSLDSNSSEDMEIDSSSNDGSGDSLAFSSSSESGSSSLSDTINQPDSCDNERDVTMADSGPSKRLNYNTSNDNAELQGEDIEEDDTSECSGGTVVANDFPAPPENATEEEMNRYYWEVCYGEQAASMMQQSAAKGLRSAPAKSWLVP